MTHIYRPDDKMIDLISDNYSLLQVMSRFGLSPGFGDQTVQEVCERSGVDCRTFLAVVNFVSGGLSTVKAEVLDSISVAALVDYLRQAHLYFLEFSFPAIRRKLIEAIDCSRDDVSFLILKFFDEYTGEVRKHMEYEEKTLFTYVDALMKGTAPQDYPINTFSKAHDEVSEKLAELKSIIIKYCPAKANENLLNAALFDIYLCEEGLNSHCKVEDEIFVPAILKLERKMKRTGNAPLTSESMQEEVDSQEALSQREKEIVVCVVKGMRNKEIADRLFLSIHTVITHRKNISKKLKIHSAAGLTIYAIVNKLVALSDVKGL